MWTTKEEKKKRILMLQSPKNYFGYINYFYCNQMGHHIKQFLYRNGTYVLKPHEKLIWLPKAFSFESSLIYYANYVGPKTYWLPYTKV